MNHKGMWAFAWERIGSFDVYADGTVEIDAELLRRVRRSYESYRNIAESRNRRRELLGEKPLPIPRNFNKFLEMVLKSELDRWDACFGVDRL
jgi:hypothetical protein